jgi:hypothetical protein
LLHGFVIASALARRETDAWAPPSLHAMCLRVSSWTSMLEGPKHSRSAHQDVRYAPHGDAFGEADHRHLSLLCAASVSLGGCGKSERKPSSVAPDAGRLVPSAPPSAVASSPWITKRADGTYHVDSRAERMEILAAPEPELAPLHAARGIRASVVDKRTLAVAPLGLRAALPSPSSGPPWVLVLARTSATRTSFRRPLRR